MWSVRRDRMEICTQNISEDMWENHTFAYRTWTDINACMWLFFSFLNNVLVYASDMNLAMVALRGAWYMDGGRQVQYHLALNPHLKGIVSVTSFVIFIGKLTVALAVLPIVFLLIQNKEGIFHDSYPMLMAAIIAFHVAQSFASIFQAATQAIFVCYLEDITLNDGSTQAPFFGRRIFFRKLHNAVYEISEPPTDYVAVKTFDDGDDIPLGDTSDSGKSPEPDLESNLHSNKPSLSNTSVQHHPSNKPSRAGSSPQQRPSNNQSRTGTTAEHRTSDNQSRSGTRAQNLPSNNQSRSGTAAQNLPTNNQSRSGTAAQNLPSNNQSRAGTTAVQLEEVPDVTNIVYDDVQEENENGEPTLNGPNLSESMDALLLVDGTDDQTNKADGVQPSQGRLSTSTDSEQPTTSTQVKAITQPVMYDSAAEFASLIPSSAPKRGWVYKSSETPYNGQAIPNGELPLQSALLGARTKSEHLSTRSNDRSWLLRSKASAEEGVNMLSRRSVPETSRQPPSIINYPDMSSNSHVNEFALMPEPRRHCAAQVSLPPSSSSQEFQRKGSNMIHENNINHNLRDYPVSKYVSLGKPNNRLSSSGEKVSHQFHSICKQTSQYKINTPRLRRMDSQSLQEPNNMLPIRSYTRQPFSNPGVLHNITFTQPGLERSLVRDPFSNCRTIHDNRLRLETEVRYEINLTQTNTEHHRNRLQIRHQFSGNEIDSFANDPHRNKNDGFIGVHDVIGSDSSTSGQQPGNQRI